MFIQVPKTTGVFFAININNIISVEPKHGALTQCTIQDIRGKYYHVNESYSALIQKINLKQKESNDRTKDPIPIDSEDP